MQLSNDQTVAMDLLKSPDNVFITGEAGSGKSYVVREFISGQSRKSLPVLASTGSAAVLVGGRTFHSFFGLGIMEGGRAKTLQKALSDKRLRKRLNDCEAFVVDEVSMLSGTTLSVAEEICRELRENDEPWGGLRVIAVGDFAQLPPVDRFSSQKPWAFLDPVWKNTNFNTVCLKQNMRSNNADFLTVLNDVRAGKVCANTENFLNSKTDGDLEEFDGTRLFPLRKQTDSFNEWELGKLDETEVVIPTQYYGSEPAIQALKKSAPISDILVVKNNAFVMLRQNDPKKRWVNGSTGHIREINDSTIMIELLNGRVVEIEKFAFSMLNADGLVTATATNFPISLAYATTIHKSQGMTIDKLMVNLDSLWEPGQAYVALSRVIDPDNLKIQSWSRSSIKSDPEVTQFYSSLSVE